MDDLLKVWFILVQATLEARLVGENDRNDEMVKLSFSLLDLTNKLGSIHSILLRWRIKYA